MASNVALSIVASPAAFSAIQTLDIEGHLHFELSSVCHELLRLFSTCSTMRDHRSIIAALYKAFPSTDSSVREGASACSFLLHL